MNGCHPSRLRQENIAVIVAMVLMWPDLLPFFLAQLPDSPEGVFRTTGQPLCVVYLTLICVLGYLISNAVVESKRSRQADDAWL